MSDINEVRLIGKLGADPQVRRTTDAGSFVVLSLATNKRYKNAKGEVVKDTQWHRINLNNSLGDKAATYRKGDKLFIAGHLRSQRWQDETGNTRYTVAIEASVCELMIKQPIKKALKAV